MKIIFRTDGNVRIGSGHVIRCLTLAEALKNSGATVIFIARKHVGNINHLITKRGFRVVELSQPEPPEFSNFIENNDETGYISWLGVDVMQDVAETIYAIGKEKPDWLIVDHYSLGENWEIALRPYVRNIMVVDDLANRIHECDILLDQNWFANMETRYTDLLQKKCTKLLGPKYALLRPEFAEVRKIRKVRNDRVNRVFVYFGNSDIHNFTGMTLMALSEPVLTHLFVDVIIGDANIHLTEIQKLAQSREHTRLHIQVRDIASIMSRADLAIGAGGATTWERMCLDLESHIIISADNQREVNEQLANHGYITLIGFAESINIGDISTHLRKRIFENNYRVKEFVPICDGLGVKRVIDNLIFQSESAEKKITENV